MTARATAHEALTDCPACDKPITAEVAYDLTLDARPNTRKLHATREANQ